MLLNNYEFEKETHLLKLYIIKFEVVCLVQIVLELIRKSRLKDGHRRNDVFQIVTKRGVIIFLLLNG